MPSAQCCHPTVKSLQRLSDDLRRAEAQMPGVGDIEYYLASLSPDLRLPLDACAAGRSAWPAGHALTVAQRRG